MSQHRHVRSLPSVVWIVLALGAAWSGLLCVSPAPQRFWSWQLQGTGLALAGLGSVLLGARMDLRGAWMMPIWVAVCFTHSLWAIFAGSAISAAFTVLGVPVTPSAGVPMVAGTGAVLVIAIIVANRHVWSLLPLLAGITVGAFFASLAAGSLIHSRWYGACASSVLLGALGSLAWGVAEIRARASRIGAGHCPSCGYDTRSVDGACPECGKHRDEVRDNLV